MDLFGDLPEPESGNTNSARVGEKRRSNDDTTSLSSSGDLIEEKKSKLNDVSQTTSTCYKCKFKLKGFVAAQKGEREEMQDAHNVLDNYINQFPSIHPSISRLALYCVYDGHGGVRASRFASQKLPLLLQHNFPKGEVTLVEKEIKRCFIETFKKLDEEFLQMATGGKNKPSWKDGSTAVCVLVINDTLYIANLGDSKAVLCRYNKSTSKYTAVALTTDHSPSLYEERIRIQKAGGTVRDGRVMGVLEVSRSLGDGPYKRHGVTCVPDIKRCQLTNEDRYLMIACDGLWKSFTMEESIEFVNKILDNKDDNKYETVCNKLSSEAVLRLSGDNVTVLLTSISKHSHY